MCGQRSFKIQSFLENARLLNELLDIMPLLYGSLGLEYLTNRNLNADDIDILIPKAFMTERWAEFREFLEGYGYTLIDEHEHTFEKSGIHYAYASIEELESFAGICMNKIRECRIGNTRFKLLSLEQYLAVYCASAKDGYRANVKEKRDYEKITLIKEQLKNAKEEKMMKPTYIVKRVEKPDWNEIAAVELHHQPWLTPNAVEAKAQLCHDGEKLYVRMTAKEEKIRAELTDVLSQVCNDSCLEFFFAPCAEDACYFNFEVNPLGTMYLGFGAARNTRVRQIVKDAQALFAFKPFETEDGWGIEYEVPASYIQLYRPEFKLAGEAACNFYKCGDKTEIKHYLAWSDLTSEKPDYHRRWDFGTLVFE